MGLYFRSRRGFDLFQLSRGLLLCQLGHASQLRLMLPNVLFSHALRFEPGFFRQRLYFSVFFG